MILETGKLLQQRGTIMSESKGIGKVGVWDISNSTEEFIIKPVH